ncbi:MAG: type II pantothenate kinase [Bacteroidaceae bacterium]|nr:type II pantothenate kinase [Bacteroidaceae bacterium]
MEKIIIGLDVGISTTKIVGIQGNNLLSPIRIKATDPVSSLYGAFGKFLHDNKITLEDIEKVMITGVGCAYVNQPIYGCVTERVDEYIADALGASYKCDIEDMIVVSMGTGTTYVKKQGDKIEHIGGLGIGGGSLQGMARVMLKTDDMKEISSLAKKGDVKKIDLLIGDISPKPLPNLPMDVTASLFAKAQTNSLPEDIALGIVHMVLQSIGSGAIFASLNTHIKDMVLIGQLSLFPQWKQYIFPQLEKLYKVRFHIPQNSLFCTAIGAAIYGKNKKD